MMQDEQIVLSPSTLYIVPTPIGNLGDITLRALSVLKAVDMIAAEDTRHTNKLLQHFAINRPMVSMYDHNEQQKVSWLIKKLQSGLTVALVSDAGTPLINDPGYYLVQQCHDLAIRVIPLPGACAAVTALSAAGLPADRFCYEGFLPAKSKARLERLEQLQEETRTLIFYESPHRILDSLQDLQRILGAQRYIVLAKELTKVWETIIGKPISEMISWLQENEKRQRGEIVLLVEGYRADNVGLSAEVLKTMSLLQVELPLKKAAALAAEIHGVKKNQLYRYALEHSDKQ